MAYFAEFPFRYPLTKLMQMYICRELAEKLPLENGVVVNYIDPGLCSTNLTRDNSTSIYIFVQALRFLFARTAEQGSRTLLHALVASPSTHGKFVGDCKNIE